MKVIIAEKPSVGKDIARVLGVTQMNKGYMEGNGYAVTWAFGHLVTLAMPEDYRQEKYTRDDLPILPEPFLLIPKKTKGKAGYKTDDSALAQLKLIGRLFEKCESIIVATDAGREGELIFRNIYNYLECTKPFSRLWISSLTDKAIKEGFDKLKDGTEYDSLYMAADGRSKADWMAGINTSRALSYCLGESNNSLGRVQTPTLAMICRRYSEYTNFKPQPFWEIMLHIEQGDGFEIKSTKPFFDKPEADSAFELLKNSKGVAVDKIEEKQVTEQPPLLHDLASLQKEANKKYGMSAGSTLSIAQKLYEHKYITYPRTGSRYIPDDIYEQTGELLEKLKDFSGIGKQAGQLLKTGEFSRKSVDASKVTDHHAILITGVTPSLMDEMERKIYDLVATRFIEAFSKPCIRNVTTIDFSCENILFRVKGNVIINSGWRNINGEGIAEEDGAENQLLPSLKEGEILVIRNHNLVQKKTKPTPLYTEATLLTAMETAGKDLEDEQAKQALKGLGIGTAATRAAIIETLLTRDYIQRQAKNLVPTQKGMEIFKAVKSMRIADVEMTGQWELAIEKIIREPGYYDTFLKGMQVHTRQMTDEILNMTVDVVKKNESPYLCPKCKLGKMVFYPKIARCNNSKCKHIVYRRKSDRDLTDEQLSELFHKGRTKLIKGFKNKLGQPFDAVVILDADCNLKFDFSDKKNTPNGKKKK